MSFKWPKKKASRSDSQHKRPKQSCAPSIFSRHTDYGHHASKETQGSGGFVGVETNGKKVVLLYESESRRLGAAATKVDATLRRTVNIVSPSQRQH